MRRAALSTVVGVILAITSVLAPTASAAGGDLAGTWTSVDTDGSIQTLDIMGSGRHAYSMVYVDDAASACGGNPARLSGPGFVDGDELVMLTTLVCLPGGRQFGPFEITFEYDADSDTLTDQFGIVWQRAT